MIDDIHFFSYFFGGIYFQFVFKLYLSIKNEKGQVTKAFPNNLYISLRMERKAFKIVSDSQSSRLLCLGRQTLISSLLNAYI